MLLISHSLPHTCHVATLAHQWKLHVARSHWPTPERTGALTWDVAVTKESSEVGSSDGLITSWQALIKVPLTQPAIAFPLIYTWCHYCRLTTSSFPAVAYQLISTQMTILPLLAGFICFPCTVKVKQTSLKNKSLKKKLALFRINRGLGNITTTLCTISLVGF